MTIEQIVKDTFSTSIVDDVKWCAIELDNMIDRMALDKCLKAFQERNLKLMLSARNMVMETLEGYDK